MHFCKRHVEVIAIGTVNLFFFLFKSVHYGALLLTVEPLIVLKEGLSVNHTEPLVDDF